MATFVATQGTTNSIGNRYTPATDTYDSTRFYTYIDLSAAGLTLGSISSVSLNIFVAAVIASADYKVRSSISTDANDWGATLDSTEADFISTSTTDHGVLTISTTGYKSWPITASALDLAGITWFRVSCMSEGDTVQHQLTVNSQNNASNKPYLAVTVLGGPPMMLPLLGVGTPAVPGGTTNYNGPTTDGQIRASEVGGPFISEP